MDFGYDAAWARYYRGQLQRRYCAGTFIAIADGAVVEWGPNEDEVRARAHQLMGELVYVVAVSSDPVPDFRLGDTARRAEYEALETARAQRRQHRRFFLSNETFHELQVLDVLGQKTEFVDGVVVIDGVERRYADHDYRLMVERGIVPADTVLIAGVIFRRSPERDSGQ